VSGPFGGQAPKADGVVMLRMAEGEPRFVAPSSLRADGTVLVANVSDEIHELAMRRVKAGTTDDDVQRFFEPAGNGVDFARLGPVCARGPVARRTVQLPVLCS
jgi:hypothetical protein